MSSIPPAMNNNEDDVVMVEDVDDETMSPRRQYASPDEPLIVPISASEKVSNKGGIPEPPYVAPEEEFQPPAATPASTKPTSPRPAPFSAPPRQPQEQQQFSLEDIMRALGVHPEQQKAAEAERQRQERDRQQKEFAELLSSTHSNPPPASGHQLPSYPQYAQHHANPYAPGIGHSAYPPHAPPQRATNPFQYYSGNVPNFQPHFTPVPQSPVYGDDDEQEMPYNFGSFFGGRGRGGNTQKPSIKKSQVTGTEENDMIPVQVGTTPEGLPIVAMMPISAFGKIQREDAKPSVRVTSSAPLSEGQSTSKKSDLDEIETSDATEGGKHHVADPSHLSDCYIGIDLGACNAHVAVYDQGHITVLPNEEGNRSTPSWIVFDPESEQIYHGDAARNTYSIAYPKSTVFDFLLLLNKKLSDPWVEKHAPYWPFKLVEAPVVDDDVEGKEGDVAIEVLHNGQPRIVTIEELLEIQLRALKSMAEKYLENEVTSAVISTSCLTNSLQRETLRKLALSDRVGFKHVRFYFSPSIALSNPRWIMNHLVESKILVVDAGADRVNVAIAGVNQGLVEVLHVGGVQWTQSMTSLMMEYFLSQVKAQYGLALERDPRIMLALRQECEKAKLKLVVNEVCELELHNPSEESESFFRASFSRGQLDLLAKNNLLQSIACIDRVIQECGLKSSEIDEVIFLGGHSHMRRFQLLLSHYVHNDLSDHVHRREGVVTGCAGQGSILAGRHWIDALSLDTIVTVNSTNLAFSVETMEGVCKEIIPASTHLPCSKSLILATTVDNQTEMLVQLYEGNARLAQENTLIYQMLLEGLMPLPRGRNKIQVTLDIDSDYTLSVKIVSLLTEEREILFEAKDIALKGFQRITENEMEDIGRKRVVALSPYNNSSNASALIPLAGSNAAGPPPMRGSTVPRSYARAAASKKEPQPTGYYYPSQDDQTQEALQNWWNQQQQHQNMVSQPSMMIPSQSQQQGGGSSRIRTQRVPSNKAQQQSNYPWQQLFNDRAMPQQVPQAGSFPWMAERRNNPPENMNRQNNNKHRVPSNQDHLKTMTMLDPYTGRPVTLIIADDEESPEAEKERNGMSFPHQPSYGQAANASGRTGASGRRTTQAERTPSAETQAHPLYQFLQSKLGPYELPETEIHNAYNVLMDEAIPSPSLLQEVPRDQFHETISSRNLKKGVEVALRKVHNDLQQQVPTGISRAPPSYASVASSHSSGGDRIGALEQRLAGLEDKINTLTSLLLAKQEL